MSEARPDVRHLGRASDWSGVRALVTGLGVSGFAAADTLQHLGADVVVADDAEPVGRRADEAELLRTLGVDLRLGPGSTDALVDAASLDGAFDLVVTSPGWRPSHRLLTAAAAAGLPVWGDVELAWRLRGPNAAPWLCVTGTNGKTTTVQMLESILLADGQRAVAVGNVGRPVLEAVMDPEPYDVLAVELSSYQLHWSSSIAARASAVLNIAPDHLDWHGSIEEYARAKGRIYDRVEVACIYNVADDRTRELVEDADVVEGARAIGFTTAIPAPSMVGVVDGLLVDRAFVATRSHAAAELASIDDLPLPMPHLVQNALAAAALARAHGVAPRAVRDGLRAFQTDAHRIAVVAEHDDVRWIDDSKATNTHAAQASLSGVDSAVWIAGGLAKGATFDELVQAVRGRLRGVVLIGSDRDQIRAALTRHAPEVPVSVPETGQDDVMDRVVDAARSLAQPGDVVLLAPACASFDQFRDYSARGDAFAAAVRRALPQG